MYKNKNLSFSIFNKNPATIQLAHQIHPTNIQSNGSHKVTQMKYLGCISIEKFDSDIVLYVQEAREKLEYFKNISF